MSGLSSPSPPMRPNFVAIFTWHGQGQRVTRSSLV
jgi:hypothetical protein